MSRVQEFINQGLRPRMGPGNTLQLRAGRRFVRLSDNNGNLTATGNEWEARTGEQLPESGIQGQKAIRKGNTETVKLPNGTRGITRKWNAARNRWDFTKLGRAFYKKLRRNFVVQVPVIIKGMRKDRTTYEIKGVVPISKMGVKAPTLAIDAHTPTRNRKAKQMVLDQIPEDGVIYEFSNERYTFDPDGAWVVHEEVVATDPDTGRAEAHVNSRRLGALDTAAQLYRPDEICKEAFEDHSDMLCCQRQIASILGEALEQVCSQMEELDPLASTEGCSAHLLLDFAREKGYGLVCLHNNRPTMTRMGNPILAFNIVDRHAYFYKSQVVARQVMKWGERRGSD